VVTFTSASSFLTAKLRGTGRRFPSWLSAIALA
jgi:hypothetical protein